MRQMRVKWILTHFVVCWQTSHHVLILWEVGAIHQTLITQRCPGHTWTDRITTTRSDDSSRKPLPWGVAIGEWSTSGTRSLPSVQTAANLGRPGGWGRWRTVQWPLWERLAILAAAFVFAACNRDSCWGGRVSLMPTPPNAHARRQQQGNSWQH